VVELGVDHGGSRRWHLESALVSAMVVVDGGVGVHPASLCARWPARGGDAC
jgi:hypothetical protein